MFLVPLFIVLEVSFVENYGNNAMLNNNNYEYSSGVIKHNSN